MMKVLSLFSGAGGFDLGFHSAGAYRTIGCVDWDPDCIATLRRNREIGLATDVHGVLNNADIVQCDISDPEYVVERFRGSEPDVIVGGPPCQSFSVLGKRLGIGDVRGELVFSYMACVRELQPRAFVMENVPGLASVANGEILQSLLKQARAQGYEIWHGKLCAADFGDPTIRVRYFLVGVRQPRAELRAPIPTHADAALPACPSLLEGTEARLLPYVTAGEALDGLAEPVVGAELINGHTVVEHRETTIARFKSLSPGERDAARRRNRLRSDAPALTLFAGGIKGRRQARTHIHPVFPRELTPRECARLHSFPDYWEFVGAPDSVLVQIANSVPVKLASAVATLVTEACGEHALS